MSSYPDLIIEVAGAIFTFIVLLMTANSLILSGTQVGRNTGSAMLAGLIVVAIVVAIAGGVFIRRRFHRRAWS